MLYSARSPNFIPAVGERERARGNAAAGSQYPSERACDECVHRGRTEFEAQVAIEPLGPSIVSEHLERGLGRASPAALLHRGLQQQTPNALLPVRCHHVQVVNVEHGADFEC